MKVALRVEDENLVEVFIDVLNMDLKGRGFFGNEGGQVSLLVSLDRHIDLLGL